MNQVRENIELDTTITASESELKDIIVEFVGNKLQPENEEVTVKHIVEVFAEEFPEFLLSVAEENWINGYTQALNDVEYMNNRNKNNEKDS